ncbi:MAG: DUF2958 domain-containing protein [Anaerolineae bacterium]|nr:DUF2958 domain-containing protein [Anaerolineae bacterium]
MKLLTTELRKQLPTLGTTANQADPTIVCKFFTPDSSWTWYAIEFDGDDTFYGLVDGFEQEFGSFSLAELETLRGPMGLPVERDLYFKSAPVSKFQIR